MTGLAAVTAPAALLAAGAALVAGLVALAASRRPSAALATVLDLLLAAGLLRLAGDPDWQAVVTAAVIVALRRLIGVGLRLGGRSWTGPSSDRRPTTPRPSMLTVRRLLRPAWIDPPP